MYDVKSNKAEEFIDHNEIMATLEYAKENKNNVKLIDDIIAKAKEKKGLTHREAAVLLDCDIKEKNDEIFHLAEQIKKDFYGNRIVLFAPLYLSNYCVNGCVYCPYHFKNKHIRRKKLSQDEIRQEIIALQDLGHKRIAIESGEDPVNNPIEYILESIDTIYNTKHKNGSIRRVNVNIAATTVENYKKLRAADIGTYILFQETYHKKNYEELHPTGPKHNYNYHTEAMDRALEGGINDVGLGVLYGLSLYRYELVGTVMHAEHLEARYGIGPHTISVPRIKKADDIDPDDLVDHYIRAEVVHTKQPSRKDVWRAVFQIPSNAHPLHLHQCQPARARKAQQASAHRRRVGHHFPERTVLREVGHIRSVARVGRHGLGHGVYRYGGHHHSERIEDAAEQAGQGSHRPHVADVAVYPVGHDAKRPRLAYHAHGQHYAHHKKHKLYAAVLQRARRAP